MFLFAVANLLLKHKRSKIPRPSEFIFVLRGVEVLCLLTHVYLTARAHVACVVVAAAAVFAGLLGNIHANLAVLPPFLAYVAAFGVVVAVMLHVRPLDDENHPLSPPPPPDEQAV